MSDDKSYMSFLNKANAPVSNTSSSPSTSENRSKFDPTTQSNDTVPTSIKSIPSSLTYTSDTDSSFEPIFFSYSGSNLPSINDFKQCLGTKSSDETEELSTNDFDPRGEYTEVINAVKQAGSSGDVKIFRVPDKGSRVTYYILTVAHRKLVGVKTEAVES